MFSLISVTLSVNTTGTLTFQTEWSEMITFAGGANYDLGPKFHILFRSTKTETQTAPSTFSDCIELSDNHGEW